MSKDDIQKEYESGNLDYMLAVQELEMAGYSPDEAEQIIESWHGAVPLGME